MRLLLLLAAVCCLAGCTESGRADGPEYQPSRDGKTEAPQGATEPGTTPGDGGASPTPGPDDNTTGNSKPGEASKEVEPGWFRRDVWTDDIPAGVAAGGMVITVMPQHMVYMEEKPSAIHIMLAYEKETPLTPSLRLSASVSGSGGYLGTAQGGPPGFLVLNATAIDPTNLGDADLHYWVGTDSPPGAALYQEFTVTTYTFYKMTPPAGWDPRDGDP